MRISLFIVIPICLATVGLIWWYNTHTMDFLTPPNSAELELIHQQSLASLPVARIENDAISIKVSPEEMLASITSAQEAQPAEKPTHKSSLGTYTDRANQGATALLQFAQELENTGETANALFVYERMIDSAASEPTETQAALNAILRIKPRVPLWNQDPQNAHKLTLHISSGEKFSHFLPELLSSICTDLDRLSSGIVAFSPQIHIGKTSSIPDAPTPVAIWIVGGENGSRSTDVIAFTTHDQESIRGEILKMLLNLIRNHTSKHLTYNPPPESGEPAQVALDSCVTRLLWYELGENLNSAD